MKAEDVKIGMRVKITKDIQRCYYGHGEVGTILTITGSGIGDSIFLATGFKNHPVQIGGIECDCFEPVPFEKSDLKTGMRVVYREAGVRVIAGQETRDEDGSLGFSLRSFTDNLLFNEPVGAHRDIMEVYAAPEKCEDFFNLDVRGELLFKREEKTEKQKQAEELMAKADKLKAEFEALVKQATDLAGE